MTQTPEDMARAILAAPERPAYAAHYSGAENDAYIRSEAQAYLDNLADGYDDPSEFIEALAYADAWEDAPIGHTWRGGYVDPREFFDDNRDHYTASVRSTYGMVQA